MDGSNRRYEVSMIQEPRSGTPGDGMMNIEQHPLALRFRTAQSVVVAHFRDPGSSITGGALCPDEMIDGDRCVDVHVTATTESVNTHPRPCDFLPSNQLRAPTMDLPQPQLFLVNLNYFWLSR